MYYVAETCISDGEDGEKERMVTIGQTGVTYEFSDWRNDTVWWVQSVYVQEEFRGQGVFRSLYEYVCAAATQAGVGLIRLYVDDENQSAKTVYSKLGMTSHYKVYESLISPSKMLECSP